MSKLLLCEGPCNPDLRRFDGEVADYRRQEARYRSIEGRMSPLLDPKILKGLRALTHTPHERTNWGAWGCTSCGHSRKY